MVAIVAATVAAWAAEALASPYLLVSSVLSECAGPCPPNPFDVADAAGTQTVAFAVQAAAAWAVVVALVLRLRTASPVQRLALEVPPALIALLATAFTAATRAARGRRRRRGDRRRLGLRAALRGDPAHLPDRAAPGRLFAVGALRRVLASLGPHPDATRVERDIATALRDPSLRVAFPAPVGVGFLDTAGRPVAVPPRAAGGLRAARRDRTRRRPRPRPGARRRPRADGRRLRRGAPRPEQRAPLGGPQGVGPRSPRLPRTHRVGGGRGPAPAGARGRHRARATAGRGGCGARGRRRGDARRPCPRPARGPRPRGARDARERARDGPRDLPAAAGRGGDRRGARGRAGGLPAVSVDTAPGVGPAGRRTRRRPSSSPASRPSRTR